MKNHTKAKCYCLSVQRSLNDELQSSANIVICLDEHIVDLSDSTKYTRVPGRKYRAGRVKLQANLLRSYKWVKSGMYLTLVNCKDNDPN